MSELRVLLDQIETEVADLREKASVKHWGSFSRRTFIYNLANIIPGMEELEKLYTEARNEVNTSSESGKPDIETHLKEIIRLTTVLQRNKNLEETRIEKMRNTGNQEFADTVTVPELYSDLEQKTLSLLLKSNYLIERVRIFERKKEPLMRTKGAQRNVLDLLEKREEELSSLRKKYEETRKNSFLGLIEKDTSIEIEQELNELSRKLEGKAALMKKNFEDMKENYEHFQRQMQELEERIGNVEELEAQITGKTFELITMLKKERDYVKKVLIEIEQDTIQLRNTYSKELLGLQEEKVNIRNSMEEKYSKENKKLERDLREQAELLKHFQETVSNKEKKIIELEDQNDKLKLVNKTHEKHKKAKEKFKGEEKRENKKRKKSK